jgi:hypothetical protein
MSLYSLARSAARAAPQNPGGPLAAPPPGGDGMRDSALTNAASALAKYIPKEVVTLYIAGVAAGPALRSVLGFGSRAWLYWGFVITTPLLYLLVYASFLKANDKSISFAEFPRWPAGASALAFAVWALAVPGNPYVTGPLQAAAAGFFALAASTLLSLLDPWLSPK